MGVQITQTCSGTTPAIQITLVLEEVDRRSSRKKDREPRGDGKVACVRFCVSLIALMICAQALCFAVPKERYR